MKKTWLLFAILGVLALSSAAIFKFLHKSTFCIPIKIGGFTHGNLPFVYLEIEDQPYPFILDLGFNGAASIQSECLVKIKNKTFIKNASFHGFSGKKYSHAVYEIPQLKMGLLKFHPVTMDEENIEFYKDSEIIPADNNDLVKTVGSLGWKLFQNLTLCIDIHHSMMAVSSDIETLKRKLHPLDSFTKVPMITHHDVIELDVMTPGGPLRCLLDSGFTSNCINTKQYSEVSFDQLVSDEKYSIQFDKFQIGDNEFGPLIFRPLPINLPFHVDAVLGQDFLSTHAVVLDFINQELYIAKSVRQE